MKIVACITFGHEQSDVVAALKEAVAYARDRAGVRVLCVDDCSGHPPTEMDGIESFVTPSRRGFPGAVNWLLESIAPEADRLVLINPDAALPSQKAMGGLLMSEFVVEVPAIVDAHGYVTNVRRVASPKEQLFALLFGERRPRSRLRMRPEGLIVDCPPYAPSGAIISIDAARLRSVLLREDYFWLEFSDWVLRLEKMGMPLRLRISPHRATHVGASTSVRYPMSVAGSQASSKVRFIREYGPWWAQRIALLGAAMRSLRFAVKQKRPSAYARLFAMASGSSDWKVDQ